MQNDSRSRALVSKLALARIYRSGLGTKTPYSVIWLIQTSRDIGVWIAKTRKKEIEVACERVFEGWGLKCVDRWLLIRAVAIYCPLVFAPRQKKLLVLVPHDWKGSRCVFLLFVCLVSLVNWFVWYWFVCDRSSLIMKYCYSVSFIFDTMIDILQSQSLKQFSA